MCLHLVVPNPNVSVTAVNQDIGDPLSLRCDVSTVKGITSSVHIVWMANGKELKQENGNVTENITAYTYYYNSSEKLTLNDNNTIYQCQVSINANPLKNTSNIVILNVIDSAGE